MEYQKKYQNQKTWFTLAVTAGIIILVVAIGFAVGASAISDSSIKATPTPLPTSTIPPFSGELSFNDAELAKAVKKALSIDEDITVSDMEKLEVLNYTDGTITDLYGLQAAINLKELRIKANLTDIDEILELHIEKLTIISDYSVEPLTEDIAKLDYLNYLDLSDCGITVVGYISQLEHLETLILDNNRIVGLNYLDDMVCLKHLSLKNCGIKDISDFKDNLSIEYINLDDNKIEDITPMQYMLALKEYSYENNPIKENTTEK